MIKKKMITKLTVALLIFLSGIMIYQQYNYYKQLSKIKSEFIKNNNELSNFKIEQEKIKSEIILSISNINTKEVNKLNEKLDKLKNDVANVKLISNSVSTTTRKYETNLDSYSIASKDNYIKTINELFEELGELSRESAYAADQCIEQSVTLQNLLDEYYKILNEKNSIHND